MTWEGFKLSIRLWTLIMSVIILCQIQSGLSIKYKGCNRNNLIYENRYDCIVQAKSNGKFKGTIKIKMLKTVTNWSLLVCFPKPTCIIYWWNCHSREYYRTSDSPETCYLFFSKPGHGVDVGKKLKVMFTYKPTIGDDNDLYTVPSFVTLLGDGVTMIDPPTNSIYNNPNAAAVQLTQSDHDYCSICDGNHAMLGSCQKYIKCKDGNALLKSCPSNKIFSRRENKCVGQGSTTCGSEQQPVLCMYQDGCPSSFYMEVVEFRSCALQQTSP